MTEQLKTGLESTANRENETVNWEELAQLYARVFAGPPWLEVVKGSGCQQFYSSEFKIGQECDCGCGVLGEAYPRQETIAYIQEDLTEPNSRLIVKERSGLIASFAWGFEVTGTRFAEAKYNTPTGQDWAKEIVGSEQIYYYVAEVGVDPVSQGQGIGKQMTGKLVEIGQELGLPILLRTNINSTMFWIAQSLSMQAVTNEQIVDLENSDRVIFVKF